MFRDYMITSPSLDGILRHDSVVYEGVSRPREVLRAFDRPSSKADKVPTGEEYETLLQYFQDLESVFRKKFSAFVSEALTDPTDTLKLQAMLQELIKVKQLLARKGEEKTIDG